MPEGKLAMMVCPILEDELIYNLETDPDEKNVFLLTNDHIKTIVPKLRKHKIDYREVSQDDYFSGRFKVPDEGFNVVIWMINLGLHEEPSDLRDEIIRDLYKIDGMVDGVMLYYGLCGQALKGIDDWAKESIKTPITIFKDKEGRICDDCICVPLGGTDQYYKLLKKYPGIMYLTPAMACSQDEFTSKMEMFKGLPEENRMEMMKMILDMAGYTTAMKVDTGLGDRENYQKECERYVAKYNFKLIELEPGWVSNEVADRTYREAKSFLK